ncbi:DUF4345 domain-containing protein [Shimia marina]|uniref:DUF4345 domain-containing protein n=1 Tax=Shimia marina TaxID=321267 RepID=A0A0P1EQT0_9RHOB|nr:DUF4345 domain-containing protein [Shimia marina]CUH52850.1 hypothetical protein SHM7688_02297 [Shimia marina]SFD88854.1 protein of unknown function [Shimia marina]
MRAPVVLILGAVGLFPIALSYGVSPAQTLQFLLGFEVQGTNHTHVFRAIMGLYLANAAFWLIAARTPELIRLALWVMVLFMGGLAAGRVLSLVVDGVPSPLLLFYLLAELGFAILAWRALQQSAP